MTKIVRFGDGRDFRNRLRGMAVNMITRASPIREEDIRWLSGPVYAGGTRARYTGTFEDRSTGEVWRFTYFYRSEGKYTVKKEG